MIGARLAALLGVALAVSEGCAGRAVVRDPLVAAARGQLGAPVTDEEGFVAGLLAGAGRLPLGSAGPRDAGWLHALAEAEHRLTGAPRPGEVVFFAQSVRPLAAGLIEKVEGERLTFVHAARGRIRRGVCDLAHPGARRDRRGRVVNSYLLPRRDDDLPGTRYLCGELVLGYARF